MRKLYFVIFMALIMMMSFGQIANAGKETAGIVASAKTEKKSELKESVKRRENKEEAKEAESKQAGKLEKEETSEEGSEEGSEEEHESEEKPAWKFTGWQFLFGIVAAGYYAAALKILPLIVEDKKHSGGH